MPNGYGYGCIQNLETLHPFDLKAALLAKHAQHVVLIHFPIALFIAGVAFDFLDSCITKLQRPETLHGTKAARPV